MKQTILAEKIGRLAEKEGSTATAIPELSLFRADNATDMSNILYSSSICLAAQGAKRLIFGDETYEYDANHYLITSVDMPVMAQILEATPEKPYLGLVLDLKLKDLSQLLVDMEFIPAPEGNDGKAMMISEVSDQLLDSFLRLVSLLEEPESIPVLAPLVYKEILYRMLKTEQGARLLHIASLRSQSMPITRAIEWLKENYANPFKVEELSNQVGMSVSSFHQHFKSFTSMSPIQYQKLIRLHKARQLMITNRLDASSAAFEVGYESPSQFSREYSRLFGLSPLKDVKRLISA